MDNNIYPIFDRMQTRADKEQLLGQRGIMIWFTGLSGSGKSTIAIALERELSQRGLLCRILDGDNIRSGINNYLGFSGILQLATGDARQVFGYNGTKLTVYGNKTTYRGIIWILLSARQALPD